MSLVRHSQPAVEVQASQQAGLRLTAYFGERDRVGGRLVADALMDLLAEQEIHSSILLRGIEGYGLEHRLRTDRLLTLSEDLPLVVTALDGPERIESLLPQVAEIKHRGLLTVEPVDIGSPPVLAGGAREAASRGQTELALTIHVGRHQRLAGQPAFVAVCDVLREEGVAGATTLLGVDGTRDAVRHRARFFAANGHVPMAIVAVGETAALSRAAHRLEPMLDESLMTTESVVVCRRDGQSLASPVWPTEACPEGQQTWVKLTVVAAEATRHEGQPMHLQLVRRLRRAGAAGVTSLRGVWGYHGDHAPHGDRLLSLRRHVPVATSIVDTPERIARYFEVIEELTHERGLVTSHSVPICSPPSIVTASRGCSSVG